MCVETMRETKTKRGRREEGNSTIVRHNCTSFFLCYICKEVKTIGNGRGLSHTGAFSTSCLNPLEKYTHAVVARQRKKGSAWKERSLDLSI